MAFESKDDRELLMSLLTKTGKLNLFLKMKMLQVKHRELNSFLTWLIKNYKVKHYGLNWSHLTMCNVSI